MNKERTPNIATEFTEMLATSGYIADNSMATTLALARRLRRPILLEGKTGVGKTEVAIALASALECKLIRLQCYEGLDINSAAYEWNYHKQLLALSIRKGTDVSHEELERDVFGRPYLMERPLLRSIVGKDPSVLLIDEIDRADEEFEAYLLELLADFQITIPELGTIKADSIPSVVITSNDTRDLSDALRRRCLYHYVDYPSFEKEMRILRSRIPELDDKLATQVVSFVRKLRSMELKRHPGVAETLDWAAALMALNITSLEREADTLLESLSCLLKTREDREFMTLSEVESMVGAGE